MARHTQLTALRVLLATAAIRALLVGLPATLFPRSFYDDFPWFSSWVSLLPPYNEHLTADVGGLQLAFGLLFVWAAYRPSRSLVRPLAVVWTLAEIHHFLFHVTHLDGFPTADAIGQTVLLAINVVVPILAIALTRSVRDARRPPDHASAARP
jgi:hypothetical protein